MAGTRIYYQNLLTQSTFSAFQVAGSAVAMAEPELAPFYDFSAGRATVNGRFNVSTGYTGVFEKHYLIEIHVCPDGTFATSRWRWSDTGGPPGGSWNQENLVPVSGTWVALSFGVEWQFTQAGAAPEFVLGDLWSGRVLRPYGITKALDGSRNTEYRSGTMPANSTIRIGWVFASAQQPGFLLMDDQNLPSNAVTTLFAHPTTLFTETGGFSQGVTWRANRMPALITSSAYRYWWVRIVLGATSLSYLRLSELFLGTGATLAKQPASGLSDDDSFLASLDLQTMSRGPGPRVYTAARRQRSWNRLRRDATADGGKLDAAFAYATARSLLQPFWFVMLDTDLTQVECNYWAGDLQRRHHVADLWNYTVEWGDVIRTEAS